MPQSARLALFLGLPLLLFAGLASSWWWNDDDADDTPLVELDWEDLVPADFTGPDDPFIDMTSEELDRLMDGSEESQRRLAEFEEAMSYAPTVPDLDGKRVKLPGYVVPLDFDGQTQVDEFLLVPYFGACIHSPPPPGNQVVHANADESIELESLYDPVWAVGTIEVETVTSDLAEAGYRMRVDRVERYERPDDVPQDLDQN